MDPQSSYCGGGPPAGNHWPTSYPCPVGNGARKDERKHVKFFRNEAQNYKCNVVAV